MSLNDPYFDDWVRDKINQLEAKTPDHLWDSIRNSSRFYIIVDRNKYLLTLLVLLMVTATVGYWAFHPKAPHPSGIASTRVGDPVIPAPEASRKSTTPLGGSTPPLGSPASPYERSATPLGGPASPHGSSPNESAVGNNTTASAVASNSVGLSPAVGKEIVGVPSTSELEVISDKGLSVTAQEPNTTLLSKPSLGPALNKSAAIIIPARIRESSKRKIYWEAFAGPDHVVHYIKATSTQYEGYVRQVKATESSYPSFSMGLKADLPLLGENWRMQAGLRFSQINEELNYTYVQGNKTTLKYSFNTYRGLDLPILTSYTLIHSQQLEFKVSGGALFNLASWFRGDVLDTNYQPMALHIKDESKGTPQSNVWKNSIGTSLYSSVTLYDQVFPKVQVGIEPYLRYELSPVNRAVSVYTERFVTTGLMFNIRFQLGQ